MKNIKNSSKLIRVLTAALGLLGFSFGMYLTIQANIGLAPWDVLAMGISKRTPLSFGDVTAIISFVVLIVDLLMKERIGVGTILDAIITGKGVDLFTALKIVPQQTTLLGGVFVMLLGMTVLSVAAWIYMSTAMCYGPRDSLLVGLGKRLRRLPIGLVEILLQGVVLAVGWLLGGPVGIGTVISAFGLGVVLQIVFSIVRFEPRDVNHQSLFEFFGVKPKKQQKPAQC